MEFEYWWLLGFPLFFGLGWIAARIDIKQLVSESRALPRSYFKGLNFLLNEQPDKAIEAFIEVVKVDPQTVELHFALGSLFRRRGEFDRAIRMHQNLVERAGSAAPSRSVPRSFELGQDYLKAGLLDRAEELFLKLEDTPQAEPRAGTCSRSTSRRRTGRRRSTMSRARSSPTPRDIANFYCELAASESMQSRPEAARRSLETALEANRKCVRANLLLGDLERAPGRHDEAIEHWKRIESQNPAYLALVAQRLLEAYRDAGRAEEGLTLLRGYLERYPSLDLLDIVFQQTLEAKGAEPAYALVRDELRRNPTLLGLDRLLEAQIVAAGSPDKRRDLRARAQPRAPAHPPPRALPLRELRLQGAPVPLALPGVRRVGDLSAAQHRGVRTHAMNVTVIGTGYVGLVTGACLADAGNARVLPRPRRAQDRACSNAGRDPDLRARAWKPSCSRNEHAGRLQFSTDVAASVAHGELQIIAVGTPPGEDGSADLQHVRGGGARDRPAHERATRSSSTKSTVPVGTADKVRARDRARSCRRAAQSVDFAVVSNPEFLKEGAAVEDFMRPTASSSAPTTSARSRCCASSTRRSSATTSASS